MNIACICGADSSEFTSDHPFRPHQPKKDPFREIPKLLEQERRPQYYE